MAADVTIATGGTEAAPLDYPIPGSIELLLKSLKASYDGTGAGGSFVPTVQILTAGAVEVGSFPLQQSLVAGASADVTWFPGVSAQGASTGSAVVYDYKPGTVNVAYSNVATLVLIGNSVTFDGATRVMIEFHAPTWDCSNAASDNGAFLHIYDNGVDQGVCTYMDFTVSSGNATYLATPCHGYWVTTPSAGAHVYRFYAQHQHAAGTGNVYSQAPELPMFYRITGT